MIKNIHLQNFQGHRDTELKFSQGVNVIAGQSDAGKSSVIRALWWVFKNRPRGAGEQFRYRNANSKDEVSVSIELEEGTVKRFRKGSVNGYEVDGEQLVAVRSDVPTEVSNLLNLDDHNVQTQHQPYFLISDSAGDVARKLNSVCGLDIIDACLKNAGTLVSRNSQSINESERRILELGETRKRYMDIEERDKAVSVLEGKSKRYGEVTSNLGKVTNALQKLSELGKKIEKLDSFLEIESQAEPLFSKITELEAVVRKAAQVGKLLIRIEDLKSRMSALGNAATTAENDLDKFLQEQGICPVCGQAIALE